MTDPFIGRWTLDPAGSEFDRNHQPAGATLTWQMKADGTYLMLAEGVNAKGEQVAEKPQTLVPDGHPYPVPDFPGLSCVTTRPDDRTLRAEVKREDGSIAGEGTYSIAADGRSMVAVTSGFDSQLRRFEMRTLWVRSGAGS